MVADTNGEVIATVASDYLGYYYVTDKITGQFVVSLVTPLGFRCDYETRRVTVDGNPVQVDFSLTKLEIVPKQRTRSYWATQLNKTLSGKPQDFTLAQFPKFAGLIDQHFNNNPLNPVTIYTVPQPATQLDSLKALSKLLSFQCSEKDEKLNKRLARAELMALMLNVASGKVSQTYEVSADGRTISQAITYCDYLISSPDICQKQGDACEDDDESESDGEHDSEHATGSKEVCYRLAKKIASKINCGETVCRDVIPATVANIAYRRGTDDGVIPTEYALSQNYPNPFNPGTTISFAMPQAGYARIDIYNTLGQLVTTLVEDRLEAGVHAVTWDASGQASGLYVYRLTTSDFMETKKMLLLK